MKRNSIIAGVVMSLAGVLALCSCKKEEIKVANVPTVKLEVVEETLTSVSFRITATNASEVAYVEQDDLSAVPSARAILTAGKKVSAAEAQEITIKECTPGETYYFAAAAVSESGEYSEVATIKLTAAGTACSFELEVLGATDTRISYQVTPDDDDVKYIVSFLPKSEYTDASDDEIYSAIYSSIEKKAAEAGTSLEEYIGSNSHNGLYQGYVEGLTAETEYLIVVVGINPDGTQNTAIVKDEAATTAVVPEMTFEISVTEIEATSAHIKITPSDLESPFYYEIVLASKYPDLTADEIADELIKIYAAQFNAGQALYTGIQDWDKASINWLLSDSKYYLVVFAYTPGIGKTSACAMYEFETKHGVKAEELEGKVNFKSITATMISAEFVPNEGLESIFYGAIAFPAEGYTDAAATEAMQKQIDDYVESQREKNPSFTKAEALSYICFVGANYYLDVMGLIPDTEYKLAIIPVENTGDASTKVLTFDFKTSTDVASDATCTAELIGVYDAEELYALGIVEGMSKPEPDASYYAAVKVTKNDAVKYCQYYAAVGDYRDTEDEFKTDDYLLSWSGWKELKMEDFDENNATYLLLKYDYYNGPKYGSDITLLVIGRDSEDPQDGTGVWGKSSRIYIKVNDKTDPQLGDPEDLKEFLESMEG